MMRLKAGIKRSDPAGSWLGRVAQAHLETLRKVERLGEGQCAVGTAANFSRGAWCQSCWERQGLPRRGCTGGCRRRRRAAMAMKTILVPIPDTAVQTAAIEIALMVAKPVAAMSKP
jgi:hypothetical protein